MSWLWLILAFIAGYLLARYGGDALRSRLDVLLDALLGRIGFVRQPTTPADPRATGSGQPPGSTPVAGGGSNEVPR